MLKIHSRGPRSLINFKTKIKRSAQIHRKAFGVFKATWTSYLCVDPELVQEVELDVSSKDGRGDEKSQGQVEHLRRGEKTTDEAVKTPRWLSGARREKQHQFRVKYGISLFYLFS